MGCRSASAGRHLSGLSVRDTFLTSALVIPASEVRPYLTAYILQHKERHPPTTNGDRFRKHTHGPSQVRAEEQLAQDSGLELSTVEKIVRGERKWIPLQTADLLFSAGMGRPDILAELHPVMNPRWSQERFERWRAEQGICSGLDAEGD